MSPTEIAVAASRARAQPRARGVHTVGERERPDRAGRNDTLGAPSGSAASAPGARRPRTSSSPARWPTSAQPPVDIGPVRRGRRRDPARQPDRPQRRTAERSRQRAHRRRPARDDRRRHAATSTSTPIHDAAAGQLLTVDVDAVAIGSGLDAVVAVLDPSGLHPRLQRRLTGARQLRAGGVPADGDYLVAVAAFGSLPTNPFDSSSGTGARTEGPYEVTMTFEFAEDVDVYRIDMRPGDVLGAALQGSGRVLELFDPDGTLVMGSGRDPAFNTYPDDSPLRTCRQRHARSCRRRRRPALPAGVTRPG